MSGASCQPPRQARHARWHSASVESCTRTTARSLVGFSARYAVSRDGRHTRGAARGGTDAASTARTLRYELLFTCAVLAVTGFLTGSASPGD